MGSLRYLSNRVLTPANPEASPIPNPEAGPMSGEPRVAFGTGQSFRQNLSFRLIVVPVPDLAEPDGYSFYGGRTGEPKRRGTGSG
jgi:hypothetical protein